MMTLILHLSDLHFGGNHDVMIAPLTQALQATGADLLVVSGDLTQHARPEEFRAAQRFLAGIRVPVLTVPGCHDISRYNPIARLLTPFKAYRQDAARVLTPSLRIGGLRVVSLNTVDPWRLRRGLLRPAEVEEVARRLRADPGGGPAMLVCHHPLSLPPGHPPQEPRGAVKDGLARLAALGLRVVLSGHLHRWNVGLSVTAAAPKPILHLQAGTALCASEGEAGHGFALLELERDSLAVTRHHWDAERGSFIPRPRMPFRFAPDGWRPD